MGALLDPSGQQEPSKTPVGQDWQPIWISCWTIFLHLWQSVFEYFFLMPPGNTQKQNIAPRGRQNGAQNASQNARFGDLPDVSWICYLLMGLPRDGPGRQSKSDLDSEPCPKPIYFDFCRTLGSIRDPNLGHFWIISWVRFWSGC